MIDKFRAFFLSLTIVSIMMFSIYGTTIVYADDGTPTESTEPSTPTPEAEESVTPDAGEVTTQPEDGVTPEATDATPQPEGEVVTTEATTLSEDQLPPAEEVSQLEEVPVEDSPAPVMEQLPDNTTVTIINSEGEAEPLVTQDSADAIASAYDPIWCPEGQSPTPGANGCTESFNSFTELLTFLKANEDGTGYQQAGTIYIQKDQYLGGESSIDFNTYNFNSLNNYDLTLQGGWNTSDNTVNPADTTQFNVPIIIGSSANPWIGSLTFNNISISGVNYQTGLTAYSGRDITLSNVEITNSQAGAELTADGQVRVGNSKFNNNKESGVTIQSGTLAYVTNSEFNNNGSGLKINTSDGVSLSQVVANKNGQFGADITAVGIVDIFDSVFSGNVSYTYHCKTKTANGGYGLRVVTADAIYAQGIKADDNYAFGVSFDGLSVDVSASSESFGDNTFNNNGYGLYVQAVDYVTIFNSQANNNKQHGANIATSGDVTIVRSLFNGNKSYTYSCKGNNYYGYGLQVVTTDGGIFLEDVSASGNNLFGARLDGDQVNIFGGIFNDNGSGSAQNLTGKGLEIISDSNVSLADIQANNNQLFGANIQAVEDITLSNGLFNGNKVYTYSCKGKTVAGGGYGLQIVTGGDITITTIKADDNYLYGAHLVGANVAIASAQSGVLNTFDGNGSGALDKPHGEGLKIVSTANVSLVDISASNNQLFGANIQADGDVSITASIGATSFFNGNKGYIPSYYHKTYTGYGLQAVSTNGDISLTNIAADDNYLYGAHLEGENIFVSYGSFSNNGTGNASDHVGKGLEVISAGEFTQVNLYQVTANNNQLFGADIQADGIVIVNTSTFNGNISYTSTCKGKTYDGYGLKVVTAGNIDLFDITANENGLYGAHLKGANISISATTQPVPLFSTFNENGSGDSKNPTGKGLEVISTGNVTLINVESNENQLFGANIQADGAVSISNSFFSKNVYYTSGKCKGNTGQGYGLKVVTPGNINLIPGANGVGVVASDNGAEGAILEGNNVVVVNSSFTGNGTTGLTITSTIATLSGVTASNNGVDGARICADIVSVFGSKFENNDRYGLNVGTPQLVEVGNSYTGNGAAGLFSNPTCITDGAGNNNGNDDSNHNNWKGHGKSYHGHKFGNSYHGGSSHKSCRSLGNKHGKR